MKVHPIYLFSLGNRINDFAEEVARIPQLLGVFHHIGDQQLKYPIIKNTLSCYHRHLTCTLCLIIIFKAGEIIPNYYL